VGPDLCACVHQDHDEYEIDPLGHRSRIGETLALSALGRYLRREGRSEVGELQGIARELDALSVIRPVVEAVLT
jgi:hypothetical protein